LVAPVSKPTLAKLTHFQNLAISKLEGLTILVSKSERLFSCPPVSKQGVTPSFGLVEFQNV
jgi:hypothetical protein